MSKTSDALIKKFENKKATIGILGLGYIGLPLMLRYVEVGCPVLGFDIDPKKITKLEANESYIKHIGDERVKKANETGLMEATTDFDRLSEPDALIMCVPTPLDKYREPDMRFITSTLETMKPHLREGQVVVLESTSYPGTTEEVLKPVLEANGLTVGEDIFLVYSPEREDPGNKTFDTRSIPKVIGGQTDTCLEVGKALYSAAIDKLVPVSSPRTAEMTKLLENIHRAVNIGLINEMKLVADRMDIDIYEVINAAATKPFGFTPYYPGPGLGGHCIPIDPFYLTWKAREYGLHTRFIELAGEINHGMPDYVVEKLADGLNGHGKAIKESKVLVLGIAYKPNIDDTRESPSLKIMERLREKGANLDYYDPHIPVFPDFLRDHYFDLKSIELTPKTIGQYDAIIISTDHDDVDYDQLQKHAKLIIDTRGRYPAGAKNVVKA